MKMMSGLPRGLLFPPWNHDTWVFVRFKRENTSMFFSPFCNANAFLFNLDLMPYYTFGLSWVLCTCVMQVVSPSCSWGFQNFHLSLSLCRLVSLVLYDRTGGQEYPEVRVVKTPIFEPGDGRRNLKHGKEEKIGWARGKNFTAGVVGQGDSTYMVGYSPYTLSN